MNNNKKNGSQILQGLLLATSAMVGSQIIAATTAMAANPTGGTVAVGSATITNPSSTQTVVNQSSKKALIDWSSFSISAGSSVTFNQPNSKSLTVNRVTGPNASAIDGQLLANGSVWLINANGILFGKGSQINVGALLATTSDLSDDDFKNGKYNFNKPSSNPNAAVTNLGTIRAASGGSVVLSAPSVSNQGLIQADLGTVVLGGANTFTVDMTGDNLLRYQISAPVTQGPKDANGNPVSALVSNSGTIIANGGHVMMTARAAQNVQDDVINNTGMVQATSVSAHDGEIDFDAGPNGTVNVGGTVDASGTGQGQTGGTVTVTGGTVNIADNARINASGDAGGGTVEIGGGPHGQGTIANAQNTNVGNATITADAITKGNGGSVTVWSDGNTNFNGSVSARGGAQGGNGGQVETSGSTLSIGGNANVNTTAPLGLTGDWLLDPTDITIQTGGTDSGLGCTDAFCTITPADIQSGLASTNITLEADNEIQVLSAITYSTNTLSLISHGTIDVEANITNSGSGALNLIAAGTISLGQSSATNVFNTGGGDINVIAGWDASKVSTDDINSNLTGDGIPTLFQSVSGSYGNSGDILLGSGGSAFSTDVGSSSGTVTLLAQNLTVATGFSGGTEQIGYTGSGGGAINILTTGNITLDASNGGAAVIGNGSTSTSGATTGDISITVAGQLNLYASGSTNVWIGNRSATSETGNLTAVYGSESDSGNVDIGDFIYYDIGQSAGQGGNVTIGRTDGGALNLDSTFNYNSANNLTVLSVGDIDVTGTVENRGAGDITLAAGWDGTTLNPELPNTIGAYGHGSGSVNVGASNTSVFVGSASGNTTVYGYDVNVDDSASGFGTYSQIGFHGAKSGNVGVYATDKVSITANSTGGVAQIGNGGTDVDGAVAGTIDVEADNQIFIESAGTNSDAVIGNISTGPTQSGNITVVANGDDVEDGYGLELYAHGDQSNAGIGNFGVGNGAGGAGDASGTINVTAYEGLEVLADGNNGVSAVIGNGSGHNDTTEGGITVTTDSIYLDADSDYSLARVGDRANGDVNSDADGDTITIDSTYDGDYYGDVYVTATGSDAAAIIGGGAQTGTISGDIDIEADGEVHVEAGTPSAGNTASQARIGNAGFNVNSGITVMAGGNIEIYATGDSSNAMVANFSNAGTLAGDISLESTGGYIDVEANGDNSNARVGLWNEGGATSETGDVTLTSDDDDSYYSDIYIQANGNNSTAQIGNGGANSSQTSGTGNVTLTADNVYLSTGYTCIGECYGGSDYPSGAMVQIGNGGLNATGDYSGTIQVNATNQISVDTLGPSNYIQIGNGGYQSTGTMGGNITVTSSDGDIDIKTEDADAIQIGNGGYKSNGSADGSVDVEALSGDINVETESPGSDSPDHGLNSTPAAIQIGNGGGSSNLNTANGFSDSGDVTVKAENITLETHNDQSGVQIGNGGYCAGAAGGACDTSSDDYSGTSGTVSFDGTLTVAATESLTLQTDGEGDGVWIGNGGGFSGAGLSVTGGDISTAGTINITVGEDPADANAATPGSLTMYATGSGGSGIQIGNGGGGADSNATADGNVTVGGDISVTVFGGKEDTDLLHQGSISLASDGNDPSAVLIGNVGGTDDAPDVSGNINISVDGDLSFNSGDGDFNGSAIAGNFGADQQVSGTVTMSAQSIEGAGASIANDIPNGNVTLEQLGADGALVVDGDIEYASNYDLTLLSAGGIDVTGKLVNSQSTGGGAITLVAGWDGETTDIEDLTDPNYGAFGNNNGSVTVGGEDATSDADVGDASGALTVEGYDVTVEADNGHAQIGYSGDQNGQGNTYNGGTPGTITVNAADDVNVTGGGDDLCGCYAQIGNGGVSFSDIRTANNGGDIFVNAGNDITVTAGVGGFSYAQIGNGGDSTSGASGDVTVTAGGALNLNGEGDYAQIGNGGYESIGDENGDITVTVTGNVTLTASQDTPGYGYAQIGNGGEGGYDSTNGASGTITVSASGIELDGGYSSNLYAQIGNGAADGSYEGDASGDISLTVSGDTDTYTYYDNENQPQGVAWIGNRSDDEHVSSGNVTIITGGGSLYGGYLGADLGSSDVDGSGGDVFVGFTNASDTIYVGGLDYDSGHSFTWAAAGDLDVVGDVKNEGSGDITLVAGWDGATTDVPTIIANTDNEFGKNGATLTIGEQADPTVGSAGGTTTILSDNFALDATNGNAQLGTEDGTGDIQIILTGALSLVGTDDNTAQIGNGAYGFNPGGDVTITADSISNTANTDITGDNVTIGITGSSGSIGTSDQYLDVAATNLTITTQDEDAFINSPNQGLNVGVEGSGIELNGGSLFLSAAGDITQDSEIDADSINVTTTSSGSITLDDDKNTFGSATISAAGDASVTDSESLQVQSASVGTGDTLTLDVTGDITQGSGSIDADNLNATAHSGSITLDGSDNMIGAATLSADGDAKLYDAAALEIDGATVGSGDTLTLRDTGGDITQGSDSIDAISADTLNVTTTSGAITLDNTSNAFGTLTVSSTGGGATLYDTDALYIQSANVGSNTLTLTNTDAGGITQNTSASYTIHAGTLDATATSGAITLNNTGNAISKATLSAATDATLDDSVALEIDGATVGDGNTLTLYDTGGAITQGSGSSNAIIASNLVATTTASSGAGNIILDNTSNSVGTATFTATGNVTLDDVTALTIDGASLSGYTLTLADTNSGGIGQGTDASDAIIAATLIATDASGPITLTNTSNAVSNASFTAGGDVAFYDTSALTLNGAHLAGHTLTLTDTASGGIGQGSGSTNAIVADTVNVTDASGAVVLNNSSNAFGDLTLSASGSSSIQDSIALVINGANTHGAALSLYDTGGAITQGTDASDAISAASLNATTTTSGAAITLTNTSNSVGSASFNAVGNVSFYDTAALTVNGASLSGYALTLTDTNASGISQGSGASYAITAASIDVTDSSGPITLDNTSNAVSGATFTAGGDVVFKDSTALTINSASLAGHALTLVDSGGGITQGSLPANAIIANTLNATTSGSSGSITLTNASNAVGTASFSATGNVSFNDSAALTLNGASLSGHTLTLTDTAAGGISQGSGGSNAITAESIVVTDTSGAITLDDTSNAVSAAKFTAGGDVTFDDSIGFELDGASLAGYTLTIDPPTPVGVTQGSGSSDAIIADAIIATNASGAITLDNSYNAVGAVTFSAGGDVTFDDSIGFEVDGASLAGHTLTLDASAGSITQGAGSSNAILASSLNATASSGAITLDNLSNAIGAATLSAHTNATLDDVSALTINGATIGGTLTIYDTNSGGIGEGAGGSNAISAATLTATATSGAINLANSNNAIGTVTLSANTDATLYNSTDLVIAGATVGTSNALTLSDTGNVTQTGAITTYGLDLLGAGGNYQLTNGSNSVTSLAGSTGTINLNDGSHTLGIGAVNGTYGVTVAGTLTLTDTGAVTQGQFISASGVDLLGTGGDFELTNASNNIATLAGNTGTINLNDGATTLSIGTVGSTNGVTATSLTLTDTGNVTQTQAIAATNLQLLGAAGSYQLTSASNNVATLAANTGNVNLNDSAHALSIGTVGSTNGVTATTLTLTDTGAVTQSQAISVTNLDLLGTGGGYTLTNGSNSVATLAGNTGAITLNDGANALSIGTVGSTNGVTATTLTLTDTGSVSQSQAISATNLDLLGSGGGYTLTNGSNSVATLAANTGTVSLTDAAALTIGTVGSTSGVTATSLTLNDTNTGGIGQSSGAANAVKVTTLNATASSGAINFNNASNAISNVALASSGNSTLYDSKNLTLTSGSIGGNLTLLTTGNLTLASSVQLSSGNLLAVAGWDGTTTTPASLVAGNAYGNSGGSIMVGGSSAIGAVAVGSNSGTTTLAGSNVTVEADNGYAQLGDHAAGGGDIYVYAKGAVTIDAASSNPLYYALVGNGTLSTDISGHETGNIYIAAQGDIEFDTCPDCETPASVWLGNHVGSAGYESGNLTLLANDEDESCATDNCDFDVGTVVEAALGTTSVAGSGGNVVVGFTNPTNHDSQVLNIDKAIAYDSPNNLTILSGNSIYVSGSLQNAGSGNITLISGWNSGVVTAQNIFDGVKNNTAISSLFTASNSYGQTNNSDPNHGSIEIGCASGDDQCSGAAAVGSKSGNTTLLANDLFVNAGTGYAQVGYHGAGSGAINVTTLGDVVLTGGSGTGDYAQVGDGGNQINGSNSSAITVSAGGNVDLSGGTAQEAYAQIGNGGAESNTNSTGYSETGLVTVSGQSVVMQAGTGTAAYVQIGHGGYKSGQGLNGVATINGGINVNAATAVTMTGNGADAYAQIGNGGDFVNYHWTGSSSGAIGGNIVVAVAAPPSNSTDAVSMQAGTGNDAYVQIGNGGNGENTPASGTAVSFTVGGNVTVSDLFIGGGNGSYDYGQIGNGDNGGTGFGNVGGDTTIGGGTNVNLQNGTGTGDGAGIGNDTGTGSVTGNIFGYNSPPPTNPGTIGSITQIPTIPTGFTITTVTVTPGPGTPPPSNDNNSGGTTPLEQIADGNNEGTQDSDGVADSVGNSLSGHNKPSTVTRTLIPGVLKQIVTLGSRNPNGVPPADDDYSSWGNEALWRW